MSRNQGLGCRNIFEAVLGRLNLLVPLLRPREILDFRQVVGNSCTT